uniref:Uncharacterized protein n=1 Tax=Schistocephalus solidus TaxID=70667 RepID=A0A0V0J924_SCHSO
MLLRQEHGVDGCVYLFEPHPFGSNLPLPIVSSESVYSAVISYLHSPNPDKERVLTNRFRQKIHPPIQSSQISARGEVTAHREISHTVGDFVVCSTVNHCLQTYLQ